MYVCDTMVAGETVTLVYVCVCVCGYVQCMLMIWLGAFVSLALAAFSGYSSQLTSAGSAAGVLASLATRSLPWSLGGGDAVDIGWQLFAAVFCISAAALLTAYVSLHSLTGLL